MIWRGNNYGIEIFLLDQLSEVLIPSRPTLSLRQSLLHMRAVDIANCAWVHVWLPEEATPINHASATGAN